MNDFIWLLASAVVFTLSSPHLSERERARGSNLVLYNMLNSVGMPFCVPPSEMELRGWTGALPEALPSAAGPIPGHGAESTGPSMAIYGA